MIPCILSLLITPIICINKPIICLCTRILVSAIIVVSNKIMMKGAANKYFIVTDK